MLNTAYTAIKAVNPSIEVISGGMSPASIDGTNIAPVDFLSGIYLSNGTFDHVGHKLICQQPISRPIGLHGHKMPGRKTPMRGY